MTVYNIIKQGEQLSLVDSTSLLEDGWEVIGQTIDINYLQNNLPIQSNYIPAYEFRDSFTQAELENILNAAYNGDVICRLLLLKIQTATEGVNINSDDVISGLNYLASINCIESFRINQIRKLI